MFNNQKVAIVAAIVLALFTPVVEIAFKIFAFVVGIFFTILGAVNPLGVVTVALVGGAAWLAYNRGIISEFLTEDSDDEEDWTV